MPCPYLPNRVEQQLFTELSGPAAKTAFNQLSRGGFRRSHHIIYRPACRGCDACVPVRVVVDGFTGSRSWRRVLAANADLRAVPAGRTISDQQFDLFRRYVTRRHADGEMARMSRRDYAAMVVASPVETELIEYRDAADRLLAACLIDRLSDGLSAVYSFFEPEETRRSLGSYVVLKLIEQARAEGLPYVYLGFWVENSPKMAYKGRFRPLEGFGPDGWQIIETEADQRRPATAATS
jgi:arginine-tRNA-protein transferase